MYLKTFDKPQADETNDLKESEEMDAARLYMPRKGKKKVEN